MCKFITAHNAALILPERAGRVANRPEISRESGGALRFADLGRVRAGLVEVHVEVGGLVRQRELVEVLEADRHLLGANRKSTRLNSSHALTSYAVFCLKKKN